MSLQWFKAEDFLESEPPKIPWVIEGFLARGAMTLLVGEPGLGKSLISLSACASVTEGHSFLDMRTKRRKVAIIDAENGADELHRRCKSIGLVQHARLAVCQGFQLPDHLYMVEDAMGDEAATGLVVIDSFRTVAPGVDENSSDEVTQVLQQLQDAARQYDVAVLVLHHRNKGGGYRGSTAFAAVPEIVVHLAQKQGDTDQQRRYLWWEKCRLGPKPFTKWLAIGGDGTVREAYAP